MHVETMTKPDHRTRLDRRGFLSGAAAASAAGAFGVPALAKGAFSQGGGTILEGADVVGYFRTGGVVGGRIDQAVRWKGAVWLFADAENREAFERDPWAFAPRFGANCAYAMSEGYIASPDPHAWVIADGRLYVMHSPAFRRLWLGDPSGRIARAATHWSELRGA